MLWWFCSLIYHRGRHKAVGTSVTHSPAPSVQVLLFLPHYDFVCDLILNRTRENWTLRDTAKHDSERDFKDA